MDTIKANFLEREKFDTMLNQDEDFENYRQWRENSMPGFEDNLHDVYETMVQGKPEFTSNPDPALKTFLENAWKTDEFKNLKSKMTGKPAMSYMVSKSVIQEFEQVMEEQMAETQAKRQEAANETNKTKQQQLMEEITAKMGKNQGRMRVAARQIAEKAQEEVSGVENLVDALTYGNDPSTNPETANFADVFEYAKLMAKNKTLKKVLEIAGRSQRTANRVMVTSIDGMQEVTGIEYGNNLQRVCPSEMVKWASKEYAEIYDLRFLNGQLLQTEMEGEDSSKGGELVACLDSSGSMDGLRINMGRGFLFGLWFLSKEQGRGFHVIHFGGPGETKHFPIKNQKDIIEAITYFMDAGDTCFEKPMTDALEIIEKNPKFEKADIVFLTDGAGKLSNETMEKINDLKQQLALKVIGVVFDGYTSVLEKFCTKSFDIGTGFGCSDDQIERAMEGMFNI